MATSVLWHGTQTEALELLQALSRNCSCVITAEGVRLSTCAPHEMLSSDQRAVDGLLFARRIAPRLRSEEFDLELELAESEVGASCARPPIGQASSRPASATPISASRTRLRRQRAFGPEAAAPDRDRQSQTLGVTVNRALSGDEQAAVRQPEDDLLQPVPEVWMPKTPHNWPSSTRTL